MARCIAAHCGVAGKRLRGICPSRRVDSGRRPANSDCASLRDAAGQNRRRPFAVDSRPRQPRATRYLRLIWRSCFPLAATDFRRVCEAADALRAETVAIASPMSSIETSTTPTSVISAASSAPSRKESLPPICVEGPTISILKRFSVAARKHGTAERRKCACKAEFIRITPERPI